RVVSVARCESLRSTVASGRPRAIFPQRSRNRWAPGKMKVAPTSRVSDPSIEELLEFERLLFELSVRFANVSADQVVAAIETALLGLVRFLDFDRGAFWEFVDDRQQNFICTVAVEGVEAPRRGPVPADLAWVAKELRAGRTVVIRSDKDIPPEAASAAEYNRRSGIHSILVVPL